MPARHKPPRHVRRLRALEGLESCQQVRPGGTRAAPRERAVRMVGEIRSDHESEWAAMGQVARLIGVETPETVHK
jgi:hypothetical protein